VKFNKHVKSVALLVFASLLVVFVAACAEVAPTATPEPTPEPTPPPVIYIEPEEYGDESLYIFGYNGPEAMPYESEYLYVTEELLDVPYGESNVDTTDISQDEPTQLIIEDLTVTVVTRVIDGDTIEIATGERVRFIGVDTPERNTPGSDEATEFVSSLLLNQTVWLEADGNDTDAHGRLRRYVWLSAPTDTADRLQIVTYQLNALLLANGLAEVRIVGNVRNEALFREIAIPLVHTAAEVSESAYISQPTTDAEYIGNVNSQIFHRPTCRTLPAQRNRVLFSTRQEAIDAGHRPCRNCSP